MPWGWRSSRTVVTGAALAAAAGFCVLPLLYMLTPALSVEGAMGKAFQALVQPRQRRLLFNTAVVGSATALLATSIGVVLGVLLARVALPLKVAVRLALAAPALFPPYMMALSWISLGAVAATTFAEWTYSLAGVVAVLSLSFYPLPMLATEMAIRSLEPGLEEAALLVTRPRRVLSRITLPLAAATIGASALLVFVLAISEFGVPGLLRVPVFTTEVFTAFAAAYDFEAATLVALPLLVATCIVALCAAWLTGDRRSTTRRGLRGGSPLVFDTWSTAGPAVVSGTLVAALVVPVAVLAREASAVASFGDVVRGSGGAIRSSLTFATLGACAVTTIALFLGLALSRLPARLQRVGGALCLVLFAVPSSIIGIGLIGLWNRPGAVGAVYGTSLMLVLAYLARFVPVAVLGLSAAAWHVPVSHEEAAAVAGARWWRALTGIIIPQLIPALVITWLVVFVLGFGEVGATILVAPAGDATLPIRIYTLIANAPPANVAALALLQAFVIAGPLALIAIASGWRGGK